MSVTVRHEPRSTIVRLLRQRAGGGGSAIVGGTWDRCHMLRQWCVEAGGVWLSSRRAILWPDGTVTPTLPLNDPMRFRGVTLSTVWSDADLDTLLAVDEVAMAWRGADRVLLQVGA